MPSSDLSARVAIATSSPETSKAPWQAPKVICTPAGESEAVFHGVGADICATS
jgi:hypothetical protein